MRTPIQHRSKPTSGAGEHMLAALEAADWPLLVRLCRQTLRKNRMDLTAHRLLGFALNKRHQTEESLKAFQQGAALFPNDAELLINYANVLLKMALNQQALPLLEQVVIIRPDHSVCWSMLAQSCYILGLHQKGFEAAQRALESAKNDAQRVAALTQSAIHRRELGQVRDAVRDCQEAIRLAPSDPAGHNNHMLFMLANPATTSHDIKTAGEAFSIAIEPPLRAYWPSFSERNIDPWRRLRVGFISPDFRMHSVMVFAEGLLANLDRRQFELFGFYLHPQQDYITERVKRHLDHFIDVHKLSVTERVQCVKNQEIDILIDLAGHTGLNGLETMAYKPAPIQASSIGFPGTTGLQAVDYFITDEVTDPQETQTDYAETLMRLPMRPCTYRPLSRNPLWRYQPAYQVQPLPALANGYITFGSCNNLGKITNEVLSVWGQILESTDNARLLIEGKGFEQPQFKQDYMTRCVQLGIPTDRLTLVPLENRNQYLTYHRVDVALDPFPMTGGATSLDVVWMGLPVVTMRGRSHMGRITMGVLHTIGRDEWVANDSKEYIRIACKLASDVSALARLRTHLRDDVESSALLRDDLVCPVYGVALRSMWHRWVAAQEAPGNLIAQEALCEQWATSPADELSGLQPKTVGIRPGVRVPLEDARQMLISLVAQAKKLPAKSPPPPPSDPQSLTAPWKAATEFAEHILCAHPHDPVALSALSEIEEHHGNLTFAVTYLQYATKALNS